MSKNFKDLEKFYNSIKLNEVSRPEVCSDDTVCHQTVKVYEADVALKAATVDEEARTAEFIASKEVRDRDGDIVSISGISFENFIKNPVVPFAHNYGELPVGKVVGMRIEENTLIVKIQFPTEEIYPKGAEVFKLVKAGYLNAVSIGFISKEGSFDEEKNAFVITKSELLEVSIVPVPANQEAVIRSFCKEEKKETPEDVLKEYRKMQLQLRDILGLEGSDDEVETILAVKNACISQLNLLEKHLTSSVETKQGSPKKDKTNSSADLQALALRALRDN